MTRININALRNIAGHTAGHIAGTRDSVAWGKFSNIAAATWGNVNALVFAAALIACSITVGCSSEQPKSVSSNIQIPPTQVQNPSMPAPAPVMQAENKPAPKKAVHKKPATVNYTDKTYGVTFEYPRRYAIETGDAARDLVLSNPVPMNFVQPGGVALAAVELPETGFANTDFSSGFFNVSVHKTLTAEQCNEFAVPAPKELPASQTPVSNAPEAVNQINPADAKPSASTDGTMADGQPAKVTPEPVAASSTAPAPQAPSASMTPSAPEPQGSKLLVGDLGLRATEAVSGEGTRQSDSKYFHVYQNGACYEFALNVTTVASQDGLIKHVDRDKVFDRLEKILATVKINPVAAPEVTAETPASPPASITPAQ